MNRNKAVNRLSAPAILPVRSSFTTSATVTSASLSEVSSSGSGGGGVFFFKLLAMKTNISYAYKLKTHARRDVQNWCARPKFSTKSAFFNAPSQL